MKFVFGVIVGWVLFHPLDEDNKFDRAVQEKIRAGGKTLTDGLRNWVENGTKPKEGTE